MTTTNAATPPNENSLEKLAVLGQRERLNDPGISLCGSRAAGENGIAFAKAVGTLAAETRLPLISGYAKGVDLAGHVACVEAGGHTVAVLAEGLNRFRLRRELRAVIEPWDDVESHLTAVSEFEHAARWAVWRAMKRNTLICSLGKVLVAIDPGDSGGTFDAVKKALKLGKPVVVGWSEMDRNHDHLADLLGNQHVSFCTSIDDLLAATESGLEASDVVPGISQLKLL